MGTYHDGVDCRGLGALEAKVGHERIPRAAGHEADRALLAVWPVEHAVDALMEGPVAADGDDGVVPLCRQGQRVAEDLAVAGVLCLDLCERDA